MASDAPIKLTYFGIQGVAEKVRLAFHLGGVKFEDVRVVFQDWPAMKPTTPYGQLPFMEIDGGAPMAQSSAMLRYAGRLAAERGVPLYAADIQGQLMIEEALGFVGDIQREWTTVMQVGIKPESMGYEKGTDATAAVVKKLRSDFASNPAKLRHFMGLLTKKLEGKSFLCGEQVTIADCDLVPTLNRMVSGGVDHVPVECLDLFPEVKAYDMARFMALPAVVAYYESLKQ